MTVDDAEFREFFAGEYSRLCWLGFLLTGSGAEGEELAQEALVRIWWRWRRAPSAGPTPPTWSSRPSTSGPRSGPRVTAPGETLPGTSVGASQPTVVGLVLAHQSGKPEGATITITADSNERLDDSPVRGGSRRADGREYRLHPGANPGEVGRYAIMWPDFCRVRAGCGGSFWPRLLWSPVPAPPAGTRCSG